MGTGNDWHRQVARIALEAVRDRARLRGRYALTGGNALQLHEITTRPTQDVDLAIGDLDHFGQAARAIAEGLAAAGYELELTGSGVSFDPDEETGIREWEVTTPDGEHIVQVQAAFFDLLDTPVDMGGIPVVGLRDAAGYKAHAMVARLELRDFCDVACLLTIFTVDQLIALVKERDPGFSDEEFAAPGDHLDKLPDAHLVPFLRDGWTPARVREQLAGWPRSAPARGKRGAGPAC
jgi:hypothetical protein